MIYIILFFFIILIIIYIYNINRETKTNDKDDKLMFYIKWINDKKSLVDIHGKEYLIRLTYPIFSLISKLPDDVKIYPNIKNANPIKIRLNKGDSLFIPAGWWHYITSYNRNIALNLWYMPYHTNVTDNKWRIKQNNITNLDKINKSKLNTKIFSNYVKNSKPLLIKKSHKQWKASTKWLDNNYLINKIGNIPINYYKFPYSNFWKNTSSNEIQTDTFSNFIN